MSKSITSLPFYGLGVEREFHYVFEKKITKELKDIILEEFNIDLVEKSYLNIMYGHYQNISIDKNFVIPQKYKKLNVKNGFFENIDYNMYGQIFINNKPFIQSKLQLTDLSDNLLSQISSIDIYHYIGNYDVQFDIQIDKNKTDQKITHEQRIYILRQIFVKFIKFIKKINYDINEINSNGSSMYEIRNDKFLYTSMDNVINELENKKNSLKKNIDKVNIIKKLKKYLGNTIFDDSCCKKKYTTISIINDNIDIFYNKYSIIKHNYKKLTYGYSGSTHIWTTLPYNFINTNEKHNIQEKKIWSINMSKFAKIIQWLEPLFIKVCFGLKNKTKSIRHLEKISAIGTLNTDILNLTIKSPNSTKEISAAKDDLYEIKEDYLDRRSKYVKKNKNIIYVVYDIRIPYEYNDYKYKSWKGCEFRFLNNISFDNLKWILRVFEYVASNLNSFEPPNVQDSRYKKWNEICDDVINGKIINNENFEWIVNKVFGELMTLEKLLQLA